MPLRIFKQLFFNFPESRRNKIEDFILTSANQNAYLYSLECSKWLSNITVINGAGGTGKSFFASFWQNNNNAVNLDLFKINEHKLDRILNKNNNFVFDDFDKYFTHKYLMRNLDKHNFESFDQTFIKIFEHIKSENKHMLLTSSVPAHKIPFKTPDLSSRVTAATSFNLAAPTDRDIKAMVIKKFSDLQLSISAEVTDLISSNANNSYVTAAKIIDDLNQLSLTEKKNINVSLVKHALKENNAK